ncbi:insecticidal delta-endotoxin Cry8Ea1 family protein, partial [Bacillus pacificus]|nr:insecticidal delta-endotoxin Cry8Ea1 family protein [Bacillus pacificus]
MNQNYGSNEVEILNSRNMSCQPRYPFAKAPGSEFQQMNYKDWMDMYNNESQAFMGERYNSSIRDSIITSTNIIAYLLSVSFPGAGAAVGIIGALLGLLWPTNSQTVWEAFMNAVESLINQRIQDTVREKAIAELEGLQNVLELYQEAFDDWSENPSQQNRYRVLTEFRGANRTFEAAMPSFRFGDFKVELLTVYAQAANLHLLLLSEGVKFGRDWGMSSLPGEEWSDIYSRLQRRTQEYTDYCVTTYNEGFDKAKMLVANLCDLNRYPWDRYNQEFRASDHPNCGARSLYIGDQLQHECNEQMNLYRASIRRSLDEYRGLENWNLFNAFRRDMTIMVLDIVAMWPTYDSVLYDNPYGIKSEITREVYTDIRGTTYRSDNSQNTIVAIEGRMIPQPRLFRWLNQFRFYWRRLSGDYTAGQIITGLQITVQTTLGSSETLPLAGYGGTSTTTWHPSYGITWIDTKQWFEPRWMRFWSGSYDAGWTDHGTVGTIEEKHPFWAAGPQQYVYNPSQRANEIPKHRLSWMKYEPIRSNSPFGWTEYQQLGALTLGWTYNSVDPNNTISSDKITQIPAVKGNAVDNGATVVRGPGSTGGDLVKLPAYNQQGTQLRVKVRPSTTARTRRYNVRIRYASEANANLFVGKYVDAANRWYETGNYAVNQTFSGSMTYNAFKYLDTISFLANEEEFKIELRCNSGGPIYIDKIEFIPVSPIGEGEIPEPPAPLLSYTYQIITSLNDRSVVDLNQSNNNVTLWNNNGGNNQKWKFVYNPSTREYQIKNLANENLV